MTLSLTDLYCGAGGASVGAEQAGLDVDVAIDDWAMAMRTYQNHHPRTHAYMVDEVSTTDPHDVESTDLLWTTPPCPTMSSATGHKQVRHHPDDTRRPVTWQHMRSLHDDQTTRVMTDVIRFAEVHRYRGIVVATIPTIRSWWGYTPWLSILTEMGYRVREDIVSAGRCNKIGPAAPQDRRRLYIQLWQPRHDLEALWVSATMPAADNALSGWRGPLIMERQSPLCDSTMARIVNTLDTYPHAARMITTYNGKSKVGKPSTTPLPTLTTHDRCAVITRGPVGVHYRLLTPDEQALGMGFPRGYTICGNHDEQMAQTGTATCPSAARDILDTMATTCRRM